LAKRTTSHLVALAFGLTYLAATAAGATPGDSLLRGCIAAAATIVVGRLLCQPVIDVILDTLVREQARRAAEQAEDDES